MYIDPVSSVLLSLLCGLLLITNASVFKKSWDIESPFYLRRSTLMMVLLFLQVLILLLGAL